MQKERQKWGQKLQLAKRRDKKSNFYWQKYWN